MHRIFKCPTCKQAMELPDCSCGHAVVFENNVYRLTDAPAVVKDEGADINYIGYEDIGEYYSGPSLYKKIEINDAHRKVAQLTGNGVLLDLACGDGIYTVPLAMLGLRIIAMDISDKMLQLLHRRAQNAGADISGLIACRANALDIPLVDCTVDAVIANSVLHLISRPQAVLAEIHRVLKPGGMFITFDDRPQDGKADGKGLTNSEIEDNAKFDKLVSFVYAGYWAILNAQGVHGKRYSWQFKRDEACAALFSHRTTYFSSRNSKVANQFKDTFLHRMRGKGFSDQSDVPLDLHEQAYDSIVAELINKYGQTALDTVHTGYENDEEIVVYMKIGRL